MTILSPRNLAELLLPHLEIPSQNYLEAPLVYLKGKSSLPEKFRDARSMEYVANLDREELQEIGSLLGIRLPTFQESYNAMSTDKDQRELGICYSHRTIELFVKDMGVALEPRLVDGEWEYQQEIVKVEIDNSSASGTLEKMGLFKQIHHPIRAAGIGFDKNGLASGWSVWGSPPNDDRFVAGASWPKLKTSYGVAVFVKKNKEFTQNSQL